MARRKPAIGGGGKFKALAAKLRRRGAKNPAALAAWIGRKKYGDERFNELIQSGRRSTKHSAPPRQERRVRV